MPVRMKYTARRTVERQRQDLQQDKKFTSDPSRIAAINNELQDLDDYEESLGRYFAV